MLHLYKINIVHYTHYSVVTSWLGFSSGSQASTAAADQARHHPHCRWQGVPKQARWHLGIFYKSRVYTKIMMMIMTTKTMMTMMRVVECCHFLPEFLHSFPGFQSQLLTRAHWCSRALFTNALALVHWNASSLHTSTLILLVWSSMSQKEKH